MYHVLLFGSDLFIIDNKFWNHAHLKFESGIFESILFLYNS